MAFTTHWARFSFSRTIDIFWGHSASPQSNVIGVYASEDDLHRQREERWVTESKTKDSKLPTLHLENGVAEKRFLFMKQIEQFDWK